MPDEVFNEQKLYLEIVRVWGEYGAHAEVMRQLLQSAGIPVPVTGGSILADHRK